MARYAKIKDGRVENVIEAASADIWPGVTLVPATDETCIGDTWDGTAFARPTPVVRVPAAVTMRQGREVLIRAGLIDAVDASIDAIADPVERAIARNYWEKSQVFERHRPALLALAGAMGWTDAQLDELFISAARL